MRRPPDRWRERRAHRFNRHLNFLKKFRETLPPPALLPQQHSARDFSGYLGRYAGLLAENLGGAWRSLVAHLFWVQGVVGSNPAAPTMVLIPASAYQLGHSRRGPMLARIYQPSKTAMQSGKAKTAHWVLEFEAETARRIDPLMGWTSGDDTAAGQVRLSFETQDAAIAYATSKNIPYQVVQPRQSAPIAKAYSDNFAFQRRKPWTH